MPAHCRPVTRPTRGHRGTVVLVGLQWSGVDVMSGAAGPQGKERFGSELIAEQIRVAAGEKLAYTQRT